MIAGVALLAVGLLGWRQRLPRNRFADIHTPATLRSDAAFIAANRVAAPSILAAAVIYAAAGGLALGTDGPALTMIVGVAGTGAFALALAGGLLGHRVAAAMPPPAGGCAGFSCRGGSCGAGTVAFADGRFGQAVLMGRHRCRLSAPRSSFAGFRFPSDVIVVAVRWYLRYGLSYRDVEELLAERGITVDHVTIYRWVQRFTRLLIDAARPRRHATGDRWFVDETYAKVAGRWVYLYRAIDQFGQVIDVLVSQKRDLATTRRFFTRALEHGPSPIEVTTDHAAAYPRVLDELVPTACHVTEQYGNNPIEADHGRLKPRLRAMRGLKQLRCTRVITAGHAFIQNIRRGHYELGAEETVNLRVPAAFDELVRAI